MKTRFFMAAGCVIVSLLLATPFVINTFAAHNGNTKSRSNVGEERSTRVSIANAISINTRVGKMHPRIAIAGLGIEINYVFTGTYNRRSVSC